MSTGSPIYLIALNSARIVAAGRVALALSLVVLSMTDPGGVGFRHEPDDIIALSYLVAALAVAAVALKCWWLDHVWQPWVLAIDILVFIALPSLIKPDLEGYRIASLTTATFILLSVAIRWDWRTAGIAALVLNSMNWILIRTVPLFDAEAQAAFIRASGSDYVRNTYYFMLISLLIVWVGSRLPGIPRTNFRARNSQDRTAILDEALSFALEASHARRGAIRWQGTLGNESDLITAGISVPEELWRDWDTAALPIAMSACIFDVKRGLTLLVSPEGETRSDRGSWQPAAPLREAGICQGAVLPIAGTSGSGVLLLADLPVPSVDLLRYLAMLSAEISVEVDRARAREIDREQLLIEQRNELARNLHDSVLQTIAGVRYLLAPLSHAEPSAQELANEISRLDETLAAESEQLRATINQLRASPATVPEKGFRMGLKALAKSLSRQWRARVEITAEPFNNPVSTAMDFEMQQIIREGVSNAVRHGGADWIDVSLSTEDGWLRMVIEDNGRGFPELGETAKPVMLSQRAVDLGGNLTIERTTGGASIVLILPLGRD